MRTEGNMCGGKVPDIKEMTLRQKICQTIVVKMERNKKIDYCPGAGFFFGQIITEADEAGLEELKGYVQEFRNNCDIPPLITSDFENGYGSLLQGCYLELCDRKGIEENA